MHEAFQIISLKNNCPYVGVFILWLLPPQSRQLSVCQRHPSIKNEHVMSRHSLPEFWVVFLLGPHASTKRKWTSEMADDTVMSPISVSAHFISSISTSTQQKRLFLYLPECPSLLFISKNTEGSFFLPSLPLQSFPFRFLPQTLTFQKK